MPVQAVLRPSSRAPGDQGRAHGTWTEPDLDKLLTSRGKFLPGTTKTILGYSDAKTRADIIAALKSAP